MGNRYFELTREFNRSGTVAVLSSGQAVVWYRLAIMSKDGDWIVREDSTACSRIRHVLAEHGACYRAGAPLEVDWLAGGWSSHFEFHDAKGLRIRCDFVSRPPRVAPAALAAMFAPDRPREQLPVVDLQSLITTKQTQRAKDYPIIGALARLLPPADELRFTTDPDRILELAGVHGAGSSRPAVRLAMQNRNRDEVVVALAREADAQQLLDRARLKQYERAGAEYMREFLRSDLGNLPLAEAHPRVVALADRLLPRRLP
ncbi:MAG TPA: hypothetical protein VFZ65_14260 [Planctomycetota bacterium]|nr:hypothetical protein [Planctomycetota bacterium]